MPASTALLTLAALAAAAVQPATPPVGAQPAKPPMTCASLQAAAEATLAAKAATATRGPISYPGQADAPGCRIAFAGTGIAHGPSFQTVAAKLDGMALAAGWVRDLNADADGPTGTAAGYRRGAQALTISVEADPAPGVCRTDAPIASCHPRPAQLNYAIALGLTPPR